MIASTSGVSERSGQLAGKCLLMDSMTLSTQRWNMGAASAVWGIFVTLFCISPGWSRGKAHLITARQQCSSLLTVVLSNPFFEV